MNTHPYSIEEEEYIEGRRRQVQLEAEAKRRAAQDESRLELPDFRVLTEVPARQKYKVEDLMPSDSYVLLSAQKKSGKTTAVVNLIRSLITGEPFLGEFPVHGKSRVALVDFEMGEGLLSEWLRDAGLLRNDNLYVMTLRGQAKVFDVLNDTRFDELSTKLSDLGTDVLIADPLGPLMRAYGIDENSVDVGRVIDRLLGLKESAGISNLIGVHHHGKNDDLGARGSSVWEDTPDAIWHIKRNDKERVTKLEARGRDVEVYRDVTFDPETRRLSTFHSTFAYGIKYDNKKFVLDALRANGGTMSGHAVFEAAKDLGYPSRENQCNDDLRALEERGDVINDGVKQRPQWRAA